MLSAAKADRFISIAGPGEPAAKTIRRQLSGQPETIKQEAYPRLDSLENGLLVKTVPLCSFPCSGRVCNLPDQLVPI